jgi:hypothetical protein
MSRRSFRTWSRISAAARRPARGGQCVTACGGRSLILPLRERLVGTDLPASFAPGGGNRAWRQGRRGRANPGCRCLPRSPVRRQRLCHVDVREGRIIALRGCRDRAAALARAGIRGAPVVEQPRVVTEKRNVRRANRARGRATTRSRSACHARLAAFPCACLGRYSGVKITDWVSGMPTERNVSAELTASCNATRRFAGASLHAPK